MLAFGSLFLRFRFFQQMHENPQPNWALLVSSGRLDNWGHKLCHACRWTDVSDIDMG